MQEMPLALEEIYLILETPDEKSRDNECVARFREYIRKVCHNHDKEHIVGIHNRLTLIDKEHPEIRKDRLCMIWNLGLSDREEIRDLVLSSAKTHEISNDLLDKIILGINSRDIL
jgi:hypothetical protein